MEYNKSTTLTTVSLSLFLICLVALKYTAHSQHNLRQKLRKINVFTQLGYTIDEHHILVLATPTPFIIKYDFVKSDILVFPIDDNLYQSIPIDINQSIDTDNG